MVHADRSGQFCRSDQHVPLHLAKLLSPVPLFCILPTRTMTKRVVAWVGSVQPECAIPFTAGHVEFPKLQTEIFVDGKHPCIIKTNSSHWECLETRTAEHSIPGHYPTGDHLLAKGPEKSRYEIKGGCNITNILQDTTISD